MANKLYHQGLPLPYDHMDPIRGLSRLSSDVSYEDKDLIKKVCPKKGIIMQMTQIFIASICKQLRTENITYYTPENEQRFLELVRISTDFGRQPTPTPVGETPARNDRKRTPRTHATPSRSVEQCDDTEKTTVVKTGKVKGRNSKRQ